MLVARPMSAGIGMHAMGKLAHGWHISNCFAYICVAIGLQATVRVTMALLGAIQGAMAANVTERLWEMGDIVDVLEAWEAASAKG
jgi:hypothetical protein